MKHYITRIVATFLSALMLLPSFAGCTTLKNEEQEDTSGVTTEDVNDAAPDVPRDIAGLLSESVYAADGLEYVLYTCKTYYNKKGHYIKRSLTESGAAEIWYVAAFLEMLTEAYKLYPDNSEIAGYYKDTLDKALPQYLVTGATITAPKKRYKNISYYNAGKNSSGDFYYDDNAWICYQLLEAYTLLGDESYLTLAENNLEFLWTGWRADEGGIYWDKTFKSVGTCSTSPTATCYLKAYMLTEKEEYLERGIEIYNWANLNVLGSNGLYYAGIGDNWQPSYDNGTMLLNSSLLWQITGDSKYMRLARNHAAKVLDHQFNYSGSGDSFKSASLKTNPYYCPWAFTWLLRGVSEYYKIATRKDDTFISCTKYLINRCRDKKNDNDQYDPYLRTGCKDWLGNGKTFSSDHVVIMPSGYSSMLLVTAYFDIYLKELPQDTTE